jgi:hypothetical protein
MLAERSDDVDTYRVDTQLLEGTPSVDTKDDAGTPEPGSVSHVDTTERMGVSHGDTYDHEETRNSVRRGNRSNGNHGDR